MGGICILQNETYLFMGEEGLHRAREAEPCTADTAAPFWADGQLCPDYIFHIPSVYLLVMALTWGCREVCSDCGITSTGSFGSCLEEFELLWSFVRYRSSCVEVRLCRS